MLIFEEDIAVDNRAALKECQMGNSTEDQKKGTGWVDERILSGIVQNIDTAILLHNRQLQVVFSNEIFEKLFEINREDLYGSTAYEFMPEFDGQTKSVIESMLRHTFKAGEKSLPYEFSYYSPSEKMYKLAVSLVPITDGKRAITHVMSLIQDISHIKKLQKEAVMAAKLSSITDMAYTLAHEINNPLTGITLGLNKLHDILEETENVKILDSVIRDLNRIQGFVNSFLRARKTPFQLKKERVAILGDIIDDVAFHLSRQLSTKEICFEQCEWDDEFSIQVDRDRMYQMFLNTFLNAIKSIPERGTIQVSKRIVASVPAIEVMGPFLCVSFVDTGPGIDPKHKVEIDKMLQNSKPNGTGMGLSICKDIISSHNGFMALDSQLGQGTTIRFYLPIKFE